MTMGKDFETHHDATVDATPDQIWDAIATGPGISTWFVGRTEIHDDTVRTAFGDNWIPTGTIKIQDRPHRFAYASEPAPDGRFIAYEYLVETHDHAATTLRTVTSGFLPGDDWADEYEAMRYGTELFFATLVEYLRHFPGQPTTPVTAFPPVTDRLDSLPPRAPDPLTHPDTERPDMPTVTSADGTTIAYETQGAGPALILIDGAMCHRGNGPNRSLATALADRFTVHLYDRRGRGDSGNTLPWTEDREIDDLAAVLTAAGGQAALLGTSSGAVLAADAANKLPGITRIALYEPPFIVDATRAPREETFTADTEALIAAGNHTAAVKKFMKHVGVPAPIVHIMALTPVWKKLTAVAPTLPYDLRILGDTGRGRPLDPTRWSAVTAPALVMDGGKSPQYMRNAAKALSEALPQAQYRTLPGQTHIVKAAALAPAVKDFLAAAPSH